MPIVSLTATSKAPMATSAAATLGDPGRRHRPFERAAERRGQVGANRAGLPRAARAHTSR